MKENDFLKWIAEQAKGESCGNGRVRVGVGDDMAVVLTGSQEPEARSQNGEVLLKIDQALDGVHFDLGVHSVGGAGRKAVNRCLSDCAAMGCVPTAMMVSVAFPRSVTEGMAKELYVGCRDAGARFDCPVVGGDTSVWKDAAGRLAITVAAMGRYEGTKLNPGPILRSGGKAGDVLFVSGSLGGSYLKGGGGRHMEFLPRIELARKLVGVVRVHAMMDLSDGLAQDVPRMAAASGVGAVVYPGRLPVHADAERLAAEDGMMPALHALADGEDYELLFAVAEEEVPALAELSEREMAAGRAGFTAVGVLTEEVGLWLESEEGRRVEWPRVGWEHRGNDE